MEAFYKEFKIVSEYRGNKQWNAMGKQINRNNHDITVTNIKTNKIISFEFWASVSSPVIKEESELLFAFNCFLGDAQSSDDSFEGFCREFGYDVDSRNAENIYNACCVSRGKLKCLYDGNVYDLLNDLRENHGC